MTGLVPGLPEPEVASDEEVEPDEAELKRRSDRIAEKVRHFAEKKMAQDLQIYSCGNISVIPTTLL